MKGGWYCSDCGWTTQKLPSGMVTCARCGALGLRGFANARPKRVPCTVEGCGRFVWNDGGVNPIRSQHLWERHMVATPQPQGANE